MTFAKLIEIVADGYPDSDTTIIPYLEDESADCGDTLALFLFRELQDTFDETADDEDQLREALRCVKRARTDLDDVACELEIAIGQL